MSIEDRVGRVEEAILILRDLNLNHSERLDDYYNALKVSREDFDFKINALIDSQIKTEAEIIEIKESIVELRQTSESQLRRIENLENK